MSPTPKLTWDSLPEFAADEDIGEVVLGPERKDDFNRLATLREIDGMPKIDTFWGGRPKWLVKRFIENDQCVASAPLGQRGARGPWNTKDRKVPA